MPMNRWWDWLVCWDKAYFPYRTDHYEGWTNFPGWGVINYKTWFSTRPAV